MTDPAAEEFPGDGGTDALRHPEDLPREAQESERITDDEWNELLEETIEEDQELLSRLAEE